MKCATGFNWKKKERKAVKNSSTAGRTKGENCQANWMKKYFFTAARAYKNPAYSTYCQMSRRLNKIQEGQ